MADWWPSIEEYTPGIDKQKWLELLRNPKIFDDDSLAIMKGMLDIGGAATCKFLCLAYGQNIAFYNLGSIELARRIFKKTNCRVILNENTGTPKLWPILYIGKYIDGKGDGIFIWKLRDELTEALKEIDLSEIPLSLYENIDNDELKNKANEFKDIARELLNEYVSEENENEEEYNDEEDNEKEEYEDDDEGEDECEDEEREEYEEQTPHQKQYWVWWPPGYQNKQLWDELFYPNGILCFGRLDEIDDWNQFENKECLNEALAMREVSAFWHFIHEMSIGDIVFAGRDHSHILARGVIESEYIFDKNRNKYKHIRKVRWTHRGKWKHNSYVSFYLTDITSRPEYVRQLEVLVCDTENLTENDNSLNLTTSGNKRYWLFDPPGSRGDKDWTNILADGIICLTGWDKLDDLTELFDSKESAAIAFSQSDYSYTNRIWEFTNTIAINDIVIARYGAGKILGRGIVESDYIFDEKQGDYRHFRKVRWTNKGEWECIWNDKNIPCEHGIVEIQEQDVVARIENLILGDTPIPEILIESKPLPILQDTNMESDIPMTHTPYTESDFLKEVFIDPKRYATLKKLLSRKKNVILKGPPGVGKTFAAKRLAYSIMGEKDDDRVKVIQFHQSYSYEDFVMGYRPSENGFHLMEGPFYQFCETAADDPERPYFFIIDEINRGNLSKIFGELLMLIEGDKRGHSMRTLYSDEPFSVPENLCIIGMMNTADRSLAMIDYALRRRFAFFDMEPAFDYKGFKDYQSRVKNTKFDLLIAAVKELNKTILSDKSLGAGFRIGHSYLCANSPADVDDEWLSSIVEFELIPLIEEYWFDEPSKVEHCSDNLRDALHG